MWFSCVLVPVDNNFIQTSDRGCYCKKKKHYVKIFNAYLSTEANISVHVHTLHNLTQMSSKLGTTLSYLNCTFFSRKMKGKHLCCKAKNTEHTAIQFFIIKHWKTLFILHLKQSHNSLHSSLFSFSLMSKRFPSVMMLQGCTTTCYPSAN